MGDCSEVLFISDITGLVQCVDPRLGTTIVSYRGISSVQRNTLAVLGKDYLIAADSNKPTLTAWPLNSQEPLAGPKLVIAGKATALACTPDGIHSAIAIDAKVYVYQNNSGALLGVLTKHYRGVTKILFMSDSVHMVTCGENGTVLVWSLATALSSENLAMTEGFGNEPVYTFSHHALPVTDAYVGPGAIKGRLYTTSLDQTVKMYGLRDGSLLLSVAFEDSITALRPNSIETSLYLGTSNGKVLEYALDPLPRTLDYQAKDNDMKKPLEGHKEAVTCLQASIDGNTLVSSSDDATVAVWDMPSRQLLRVFNMKGAVASIVLSLGLENIFTNEFQPNAAFQNFQRTSNEDRSLNVSVLVKDNLKPIDYSAPLKKVVVLKEKSKAIEVEELKLQLAKAVQKNKELYRFTLEKVLSNPLAFKEEAGRKKKLRKEEESL